MGELMRFIPSDLDEALEILSREDALIVAGGSDVMVESYSGIGVDPVVPRSAVFISAIDSLKGIRALDGGWTEIGALTTASEITQSPLCHALLRHAAAAMGAVALRNVATIGGNIANASPKGDMPQPLVLLDAEVVLLSKGGERRMKVQDFIVSAKKTRIEKGELIASVLIPPSSLTHFFYRKVGARRSNAISKLSLSAAAEIRDGKVVDFRASSGAAGPKVARSREAERILIGLAPSSLPEKKDEFLDAWDKILSPRAMPEYRRGATRRMLSHFIDAISASPREGMVD